MGSIRRALCLLTLIQAVSRRDDCLNVSIYGYALPVKALAKSRHRMLIWVVWSFSPSWCSCNFATRVRCPWKNLGYLQWSAIRLPFSLLLRGNNLSKQLSLYLIWSYNNSSNQPLFSSRVVHSCIALIRVTVHSLIELGARLVENFHSTFNDHYRSVN